MTDTANLRSLLERCKAATGPNKELDAMILCALLAPAGCKVEQSPYNGAWCVYEPARSRPDGFRLWEGCPLDLSNTSITASIDACVALVEKVLPGWHYSCGGGSRHKGWAEVVSQRFLSGEVNGEHASSFSPTIPLAILTALITALIDQAERAER